MANVPALSNLVDISQIASLSQIASSLKLVPPVISGLQSTGITTSGDTTIVTGSTRTRPLWFDGRFLAAADLQRDQQYFLQNQARLGMAAGFGVIHGLEVTLSPASGTPPTAETIVIGAGTGVTPGGQLVMLSADLTVVVSDLTEEENLESQFGLAETPAAVARTRTGLFVVALRPVEFTANPITSYPTNIQGSRTTHDGSIIEATAVSLISYPIPASNFDATSQNAAAAWQVFVAGNSGTVSPSLLPVAMLSLERGVIQWVDQWMVRRDSVPDPASIRVGLANTATQQAFVLQYDAQLQQIVNPMIAANQTPSFSATDYFQALPPAGRLPVAAINTTQLTQNFFPPQTNVLLSLIPQDELPALLEDSLSLLPLDLTQPASAYADLSVLVLIAVTRATYNTLSATLKPVSLTSALPQVINPRTPTALLRLFPPGVAVAPVAAPAGWQSAIGTQVYAYYVRGRSVPAYITFTVASTTTTLSFTAVSGSQATQYSATITPAAATGTVTFNDGATSIGVADIVAGVATLILPTLAAGSHTLTAVYNGDTNYATSTSAPVTQTIAAT